MKPKFEVGQQVWINVIHTFVSREVASRRQEGAHWFYALREPGCPVVFGDYFEGFLYSDADVAQQLLLT